MHKRRARSQLQVAQPTARAFLLSALTMPLAPMPTQMQPVTRNTAKQIQATKVPVVLKPQYILKLLTELVDEGFGGSHTSEDEKRAAMHMQAQQTRCLVAQVARGSLKG